MLPQELRRERLSRRMVENGAFLQAEHNQQLTVLENYRACSSLDDDQQSDHGNRALSFIQETWTFPCIKRIHAGFQQQGNLFRDILVRLLEQLHGRWILMEEILRAVFQKRNDKGLCQGRADGDLGGRGGSGNPHRLIHAGKGNWWMWKAKGSNEGFQVEHWVSFPGLL